MDFSFLHAADIHLDSPLHGLSRYDGIPADEVRGATRAAFDRLVRYAVDERVSFVVLAGDLFDGEWRDMGTGLYFARAIGRLAEAGIPVFILKGNHDAASALTSTLPWPGNVRIFGTRQPETFRIDELGVALHGQSFSTPHVTDDLAAGYPGPVPNAFNIGVLHTALAGHANHAPYAPCSIAGLQSKGYDYWALGHVHDFAVVSTDPPIVFPGNLQGRNIRETGSKGAVIVEVRDGAVARLRPIELDVLRWARAEVDCSEAADIDSVHGKVRDSLSDIYASTAQGRPLIVRVTLVGETAMAGALLDGLVQLRDDVRAIAAGISPDLWLEKLLVTVCAPPHREAPQALEDIETILAEGLSGGELGERLGAELAAFIAATQPAEGADSNDPGLAARRDDWRGVIETASAAVLARLARSV
ncbi:MAG TPA: DNA repair exonuclease [Allosphingosinicella sp.]|nr:DNA repair exonuclease [Allosphingosinicella sp.]